MKQATETRPAEPAIAPHAEPIDPEPVAEHDDRMAAPHAIVRLRQQPARIETSRPAGNMRGPSQLGRTLDMRFRHFEVDKIGGEPAAPGEQYEAQPYDRDPRIHSAAAGRPD